MYFNQLLSSVSYLHPAYISAGIHTPDRGLSLWKCQDGELSVTARGQHQCQDQGRIQQSDGFTVPIQINGFLV